MLPGLGVKVVASFSPEMNDIMVQAILFEISSSNNEDLSSHRDSQRGTRPLSS